MGDLCSRQERQLRLHYQWFSAQSGMRACNPMSTRGIWQSSLVLLDSSHAFPFSGCPGIAEDEREVLAFYEKFRADELVCPNEALEEGLDTLIYYENVNLLFVRTGDGDGRPCWECE